MQSQTSATYKEHKLKEMGPNSRDVLHVVNSNYLKLCRGGGRNGIDRMGNLGERGREERYFPMLEREGKYNPFYSEKQTPNL